MKIKHIYMALGCFCLASAFTLYVYGTYDNTSEPNLTPTVTTGGVETIFTEPEVLPEIQPVTEAPIQEVEDWTGWNLDIPSINLRYKMTQVFREGDTIPVPQSTPGYYLDKPGNIFIVGHNNTVFQRLNELPPEINLVIDGVWTTYHLETYELLHVTEVNMNKVIRYQGVSIMTCSGEKYGETMSHRLILYYK